MNNFRQPGDVLTLTTDRAVTSGGGFLQGSIFGVAAGTYASGDAGEFNTCGVYGLAKTSAQAWTVGQKIYWDNTNFRCDSDGTVGQLIGVATEAADNPSSTGYVKLNEAVPSTSEGPQAAITSLTDNGGGTADGTVASQVAPTTLTDSTGLSGTHDDTLAATTVPADLTGGESPTEAEHNALLAVTRVIAQNASDTGQKVIELVTLAGTQQNNLKELTTQIDLIITRLRAAGVIST